jgi:hypothetical protein
MHIQIQIQMHIDMDIEIGIGINMYYTYPPHTYACGMDACLDVKYTMQQVRDQVLTAKEYREFLVHIKSALSKQEQALERFVIEPKDLICGEFEHAVKGFYKLLNVSEDEVFTRALGGSKAIEEEVSALGDRNVCEQLNYILGQPASEKLFLNGLRDKGHAGMMLCNFVEHEHAKTAELQEAEVVALRLYTTSAFQEINKPLRD